MILVTGAAGLIGNPVARRLVQDGEEVVATDVRPPDEPLACAFVPLDLRDQAAVTSLFGSNDFHRVIHCGAISGSMVAPNDPFRVMSVNVTGTILLAEASRLAGVERFLALSSIGVYGDQPRIEPIREDARRLATDIYSCSKIAVESVLLGYRENFGLPAFVLRLSSTFGPGRRTPCFIRGLLEAADEGREVTVSNDLDHRRQFLYVDDAVEAASLALAAPEIPEFIYNITGGTWLTEAEILDVVKRLVPSLKARVGNVPPLGLDGRNGPLDIALAARDLNYTPKTSLSEGIAKYIRIRKQAGAH